MLKYHQMTLERNQEHWCLLYFLYWLLCPPYQCHKEGHQNGWRILPVSLVISENYFLDNFFQLMRTIKPEIVLSGFIFSKWFSFLSKWFSFSTPLFLNLVHANKLTHFIILMSTKNGGKTAKGISRGQSSCIFSIVVIRHSLQLLFWQTPTASYTEPTLPWSQRFFFPRGLVFTVDWHNFIHFHPPFRYVLGLAWELTATLHCSWAF